MQVLQRVTSLLLVAMAALPMAGYAATAKVAVIVPLTGGLAAVGREIELTSRAWAKQVNAKSGSGASAVELLVLDDKSGADGAREAARQAMAQGATVIMNCFGSVSCMAIAQETKAAALPLIGAIAGDDRLRGADYPHVFTTRGGARDEIETIIKYLQGSGSTKVAVLYQDDGFGQSYRRTLDAVLAAKPGMQAVAMVAVDPQKKNYAEAAALAVAQPSAAVILLTNTAHSLGVIDAMNQARYRGLYFNLAAQANPFFIGQIAKMTAESKLMAAFVTTTPSPLAATPGVTGYRDTISRSGETLAPTYVGLESFMNATLAGMIVQRDGKPTPEGVTKILQSLNGTGVAGMTVRFDPARRQAVQWLDMAVVTREGKVRSY
jgi:branched-chain amino acid transport system substrate-binding protein